MGATSCERSVTNNVFSLSISKRKFPNFENLGLGVWSLGCKNKFVYSIDWLIPNQHPFVHTCRTFLQAEKQREKRIIYPWAKDGGINMYLLLYALWEALDRKELSAFFPKWTSNCAVMSSMVRYRTYAFCQWFYFILYHYHAWNIVVQLVK